MLDFHNLPPDTRDELLGIRSILNRDVAIELVSAAAAPSAAAANAGNVQFTVKVRAKAASGLTNRAVHGASVAFTVETDNVGEAVQIIGTPTFVHGECNVTIQLDDGTAWAADDTVTLKVAASELGGYDVVDATGFLVATLVA